MTTRRIVFDDTNGSVIVLIPVLESGLSLEEIAKKDVPTGVDYSIVDVSELPPSRLFRNAWKLEDGILSVDLAKARRIRMEQLRTEKLAAIQLLESAFLDAVDSGDRQAQGDLSNRISNLKLQSKKAAVDAATSPDELEQIRFEMQNLRGEKAE